MAPNDLPISWYSWTYVIPYSWIQADYYIEQIEYHRSDERLCYQKCDFNLEHIPIPPGLCQGYQLPCCELSKGEAYVARNCYLQPARTLCLPTAMWVKLGADLPHPPVAPWNDSSHCRYLDCNLMRCLEPMYPVQLCLESLV